MFACYCIEWTEYERGWGCRPDGITIHKSEEAANAFRKDFLSKRGDTLPYEYSDPDKVRLAEVSEFLYKELQKSDNDYIWLSHNTFSDLKKATKL